MAEPQMSLPLGRSARDQALRLLEDGFDRRAYVATARQIAVNIARAKGSVTSDDVRMAYPPPAHWDNRVLGPVFSDRRTFIKTGRMRQTQFKQAHARPQTVWRLRTPEDDC